jgi:glutathione synthase/RimK-type ligase-like ATP-grasp enzyme
MRVALATCRVLPEPDPDQAPLLEALAALGVDASLRAWDDPRGSELGDVDLCVIRSTWNYYRDRTAFLSWAEEVSTRTALQNPLRVLRWNTDKAYLRALAGLGIPVVPTRFLDRGDRASLRALLSESGWSDVVVKPTVSASSYLTRRFSSRELEEGERFLAELLRERDAMVQPYLRSIESHGERALVWIDGELTHAVRKSTRFHGGHEAVSGVEVSDEERGFAERVLATVEDELLYGRVDVARGEDGELMVMELELCEPSLFLAWHPPALARFAAAIRERARVSAKRRGA